MAMSRFERDTSRHPDPTEDTQHDASTREDRLGGGAAPFGSNADAEQSAAHIAELVSRTVERSAEQGPTFVDPPTVGVVPPSPRRTLDDQGVPTPDDRGVPTTPDDRGVPTPPDDRGVQTPVEPQARRGRTQPSRPILVAAGAVAVLLIGGGLALSLPFGSQAGRTSSTSSAPTASSTVRSPAPAGYAVKVTDVISDCASHARGRVKSALVVQNCVKATRSLATGRVSGRPVLFVVSRIQMASAEAAASVKQVLDGTGTGNLDDLLRDGKSFSGAPKKMPASGYASVQMDRVVSVAEAGFVDDGRSSSSDPALRAAAAQVAAMVSAQR